jgi:hypothetical protein
MVCLVTGCVSRRRDAHYLVSAHHLVSVYYLVFTHYLVFYTYCGRLSEYRPSALFPHYYGASEVLLPYSENTLESDHVTPRIYQVC